MTFGSGQGALGYIWKTPQDGADAIVGRALDAGVNLFDSADMYAEGESEQMLAKALGSKRGEVLICTKAGFRASASQLRTGLSARHLLMQVDASLARLKTDWLDLFVLHRLDPYTPLEETLRACEDLVRSGKVRYVGYSNWPAWRAAEAVAIQRERGWARFCAGQMYASLVGRDVEHETVPFMRAAGVGMMVWSPLAGGFLSGRYTRKDPTGGKGRVASFDFLPMDKERGYDVVEELARLAAAKKATAAQLALAWLLAKDWASTILLGASSLAQLEDNLGALDVSLSKDELSKLDAMTAPPSLYPNWFNEKTADAQTREALGPPPGGA
jgi:aryl-alcohol dehydrogenase-like predicted oxidoreductase